MKFCDLTLSSPEENLACDEAFLDHSEEGLSGELLRFWEPAQHFVVLGYANHADTEADLPFCAAHSIPVLRRCSGGGTVLQGPGCLNYSLILRIDETGPFQSIRSTNEFVLRRHVAALSAALRAPVEVKGQSDLAIRNLKFSGNAQRRKKHFLIFHGTFLLDFDLGLINKVLRFPTRQPEYRSNRSHIDFLMNLKVSDDVLKKALMECWNADEQLDQIPQQRIATLAREKYSREDWNLKF